MKKFFCQHWYCLFYPILFIIIGIFPALFLLKNSANNPSALYIIGVALLLLYFLYFLYILLCAIEFVSFNECGIAIKNIFRTINIKWSDIKLIDIERSKITISGNVYATWILIQTDSAKKNKGVINLNKKGKGLYNIIAKTEIAIELRSFVQKYRKDLEFAYFSNDKLSNLMKR